MQPEHADINALRGNQLPDDDLIARMNAIRNSSERHVVRMHAEAERLVDWREHVRSQPMVAVGVAAAAGFFLLYRSRGSSPSRVRTKKVRADSDSEKIDTATAEKVNEATTRTSLASGAMAFVGTMAGNMLKQYATNYVKGKLAGVHHDRNADQQSEVHSPRAGQSTGRW